MREIRIKIDGDVHDLDALLCVAEVVKEGKISKNGECYCLAASFSNGTQVHTSPSTKTTLFYVGKSTQNEW